MSVKEASVVVIFLTDRYLTSENCMREYNFALHYKVPIIPVLLDGFYSGQDPAIVPLWPPHGMEALDRTLYIDMRSIHRTDSGLAPLMRQIDAFVRSLRFTNRADSNK